MPHPVGGRGNGFDVPLPFLTAYGQVAEYHAQSAGRWPHTTTATGQAVVVRTGETEQGLPTLVFEGHGNVCAACWGYTLNCSGTRVGHCVRTFKL